MGRSSSVLESEIRRAKEEAQHWKLSCLVLKYQNAELKNQLEVGKGKYNELYLESEKKKSECGEVKKTFETLIVDYNRMCDKLNERIEPSMITYRRKRNVGDQRNKCVKLDREIETFMCGKKRATLSRNHEIELEDCKIKCHGLAAELKGKEMECVGFESTVKSLMLIKDALDEEIKEYRARCIGMEEKITGLIEERKGMFQREKMALERIGYLEEVAKNMKSDKTERTRNLRNEVSRGYILKKCVRKKTCRTIGSSVTHLTKAEMICTSAFQPSIYPSPVQGNIEDIHVAGTMEISDSEDTKTSL
ncbi:hypothetical protein C5167_035205 [Papaver somniferum]|uniref:Uncharacterized protein n=1 Tax=Papaver somniferum TaxID=3469 RepID=A0A4Y7KI66_PAPSO|nr:uncharacterized protein LOC113293625 [Papaver somniferum]RZC72062.1 hypothetical protein C5167_035205 [Papaver somniferum]